MKKWIAVLIVLLAVLGNRGGLAVFAAAPSGGESVSASGSESGGRTEKPRVTISGWRKNPDTSSSAAYIRDIDVSDGGNYLMTYREYFKPLERTDFYYTVIYNGHGQQNFYGKNLDDYSYENGKLLPFETMEECGLDIDQVITDHIQICAEDESSFILVFRYRGGKRDGQVDSVRVAFGSADMTSDSYEGVKSLDLLGVFRFPDEERRDLTFGSNLIQKDYGGYRVQMIFLSDYPDGLALITYMNAHGNEVYLPQVILNGYGVCSVFDPAKKPEDIRVGRFGIVGYSHHPVEAVFINQ